MKKMYLYNIEDDYIDYLRTFDNKVMSTKRENRKYERKYIGVLFEIGEVKYFAPLSSPKKKHFTMSDAVDFIKIQEKDKLYGVINLNNMIPVKNEVLKKVDINGEEDAKYKQLLLKEHLICNRKNEKININAKKLYKIVTVFKTVRFLKKCCDFKLLEEKCSLYNEEFIDEKSSDNT